MNRFVFIAPTYNAEKTARQALLSLAAQSYENWKLIVVDDMSTDSTFRTVLQLSDSLGFHKCGSDNTNKVQIISNKEKKWEVANVLEALKHCDSKDIICRFDLDDYLIDTQALEIINMQYAGDRDLEALWTGHRWFDQNGTTNRNISGPMPENADVYKHPWVSSHLKTFRKSVIDGIPYENFLNMSGDLVKRAGDQCLFLPVLYKAKKRMYLPIAAYAYRCDMSPQTFQTEDAKFQKAEADFIRQRGFVNTGSTWEEITKT